MNDEWHDPASTAVPASESDWAFSACSRQLNVSERRPGVSGYMRLRNEVAFVEQAISSHLPFLDELVIVDNNSSDGTWECVQKWSREAPGKIRAFRYRPVVHPLGTRAAASLPTDHPSSFANYCNFALARTRHQIAVPVDGDHVAIPGVFAKARDFALKTVTEETYVSIFGVNLLANGPNLYIANSYGYRATPRTNEMRVGLAPFTHGEHAFFFVTTSSWYRMDLLHAFEVLPLGKIYERGVRFTPVSFLHAKGLKADRGTSNWQVEEYDDSLRKYWAQSAMTFDRSQAMTLDEARLLFPAFLRRVDLPREVARLAGNYQIVTRDGLEHEHLYRLAVKSRIFGALGSIGTSLRAMRRRLFHG